MYGAPTSVTLIGSSGSTPDTLKASTAVSGSPLSLTTQPVAPGQLLQLTVTGASGGGSIAITGTNQFGIAASETVACNAGNGTYYTQNVYSAVASSGIAVTGLSSGSLTVKGIFGATFLFTMPTDPIYTCGVGAFSGTDTSAYPFAIWESGDFTMDVEKEIMLSSKVITQDGVPLGNRSTNPLVSNQLPTFGQPSDFPVAGWSSTIDIDDVTSSYGTTQYMDLLDVKISANTGAKATWVAQAQQQFARFYRDPPDMKFDATIDFLNLLEYEKFRNLIKRRFAFKFQERNRFIGNSSSTPIYKTWLFNIPAKYEMFERDRSKEKVTAKLTGTTEYSEGDGNAGTLSITCQQNPNYATL